MPVFGITEQEVTLKDGRVFVRWADGNFINNANAHDVLSERELAKHMTKMDAERMTARALYGPKPEGRIVNTHEVGMAPRRRRPFGV